MASTTISDIVTPSVFTAYMQLLSDERSAFVQSGVMLPSPLMDEFLAGGGTTVNVPHFNDLADTAANISDDSATLATAQNIGTGTEIAIRHSLNQSWGSFDLAAALAGADPLEAVASRVADYWVRQSNRYLIASIQGVMADNIANDSSDMLETIVIGGAGTLTAAHLFSAEAFLDAAQTLGENAENVVALAVHSVVYTRMQKNNLIDFIPDSQGVTNIPTFLGRRVIVDDQLPKVDDSNSHFDYSSYLFGAGSIAFGRGNPKVPTEVNRIPAAGDGGGEEVLHSRQEFIIHPQGFAFVGSPTKPSPTIAEAQAASSWDRRVQVRGQVAFAELRTNG